MVNVISDIADKMQKVLVLWKVDNPMSMIYCDHNAQDILIPFNSSKNYHTIILIDQCIVLTRAKPQAEVFFAEEEKGFMPTWSITLKCWVKNT